MRAALALCAAFCGCAASPPRPSQPAPREIVVDDAAVVRVSRGSHGDPGEPPLPPLPAPLADGSQPFQRGFALAQELLRAPGPSLPAQESADVDQAWLDAQFKPWLEQRMAAILQMTEAFGELAPEGGPRQPSEEVPAIALLGLVNARAYDQLTAIPAPARVRADPALLRVYQGELYRTLAGGLLGSAVVAFRGCASLAAAQVDLAFGPWLDLCHGQLAARTQQQSHALALLQAVSTEREAERAAAAGARPPGPEICWTPMEQPAGADPLAGQALSPRDQRYGARDARTSVRVSAALAGDPTIDARPLGGLATRARLARCFAEHVRPDQPITVAVHANLSVDALGRTQSVALTPEPAGDAAAPGRPLAQCLQRALAQTAFGRSASGQPAQARAAFCMRRD